MGFLDLSMTIRAEMAQQESVEAQMTDNRREATLRQKQSTATQNEIENEYDAEIALVKNEMNADGMDATSKEYEQLMLDYRNLQDEKDKKIAQVQDEANDYQTKLDVENDMLETINQDLNQDIEAFKEARKEDIEQSAGYFN